MFIDILLFILGFVILVKGADVLVDGSSSVAKKFGVSSFFIGLTIVAFGTSMPELVVSLYANITGSSEIALGNVVGSNIANTLLILGVSAMIAPLLVKRATIYKEIPFSLLAVAAVGILINDTLIDGTDTDSLTRIDGLILILFFLVFIYYTFGISREKESIFQKTIGGFREYETHEYGILASAGMILLGLAGLTFGGRFIVDGAVSIALFFGLSEALIGLTIIALGTSLPELAASGMAAYRGNTDIAVGNVVGSNIFNLLWVLGLSAIAAPIPLSNGLNADMMVLFIVTIMLIFFVYIGKKNILSRWGGAVLTVLYFAYIIYLIIRT